MRRIALGLLLLCLGAGQAEAQSIAKVGTVGAQFLKIEVGARGIAMGDAYAVTADDASAVFWNPAGLARLNSTGAFLNHSEWIADLKMEAGSVAKHIEGIGTFGLSFSYLTSGDMEETTVQAQNGTGNTFSTSSMMAGLSFARFLTDKFAVGGTVKFVREDLGAGLSDDLVASTIGVDLGTTYDTGYKSVRIGLSIRNFGPELQPSGSYVDFDNGNVIEDLDNPGQADEKKYRGYRMPLSFQFGLAMDPIDNENNKLTLAVAGEHPSDNLQRVNVGGEYSFQDLVVLRTGYSAGHDTRGISAGGGIRLPIPGLGKVTIDYAYTDFRILDTTSMFSVTFDF